MSKLLVRSASFTDPQYAPLSFEPPPELVAEKVYPQFSVAEHERRYSAVRTFMREQGLDCLILMGSSSRRGEGMGNLRYLSGLADKSSACSYLLFPVDGEPVIFLGLKVKPSGVATSWVADMRPFSSENAGENLAQEISIKKMEKGKIGLVGADYSLSMPYNVYQTLKEKLPDAHFIEASNMLYALRLVKSQEEIEFIRRAAKMCDRGYYAELSVVRPGLTEFQLQASILKAMFDVGCEEPALVLVNSCRDGGPVLPVVDPYPSGRVIRAGDTVFTEITGQYGGYCAQSLHTVCVGSVDPKTKEMFRFACDLLHTVLHEMKPEKTWNEVASHGARMLEGKGYTRATQFFHSIGLGFPDPDPRPRGNIRLKPGMVFSVEASPVTSDGRWGALLGQTVVIAEKGVEALNKTDLVLSVV